MAYKQKIVKTTNLLGKSDVYGFHEDIAEQKLSNKIADSRGVGLQ